MITSHFTRALWLVLLVTGMGHALASGPYGASQAKGTDPIIRPAVFTIMLADSSNGGSLTMSALLRAAIVDMANENKGTYPDYAFKANTLDPWIENILVVEMMRHYMVVFTGRNNGQRVYNGKVSGTAVTQNYIGYFDKETYRRVCPQQHELYVAPIEVDLYKQLGVFTQYFTADGSVVRTLNPVETPAENADVGAAKKR